MKERGCDLTGTASVVVQHFEICVVLEGEGKEKTLGLEEDQSFQWELRYEFCSKTVRACEMNPHLESARSSQ